MRSQSFFAAVFVAVLAMPAIAQNPPASPPARIRGTVEKLDGNALTVKSREGEEVTVTLAPNVTIRYLVKKSLADIKDGDFVASTSVKGTDGKNHSVELRIFPEAMRGVGEGQYPWDLSPGSLMTNATVSGVTGAPQGQTLKVTYKGGESELVVGPDTPIFGYGAGDMSLLKPGAAVFIVAPKKPDGSLTAAGVTAEKDGLKPPM
jgi:Cu/Ag efflux protein CusF